MVILAYLFQAKLIFPAGGDLWCTPADRGYTYEEVRLQVDGHTTHGWFIPAPDSRGVFLFAHGNAGTIADRIDNLTVLHELGFDVLIYDYGGFGLSTGRPSEQRCYADARAMWRYLTEERNVAPGRIVLFGRSLGGGVTAQLATEVQPRAVILESTFLSAPALGQEAFRILPVKWLLRHRFDNAAKVSSITSPILVVHSQADEVVPYHHGRDLFELANEPKAFLDIRGGHGDGFYVTGQAYGEGLIDFLNAECGMRSAE
ncbi:MAG: alpha/beta fold hydrolase [Nitrospiraceae bacterium]|nr:alpha/beta fold hydrolase [Nitrospiraceae bacterium]